MVEEGGAIEAPKKKEYKGEVKTIEALATESGVTIQAVPIDDPKKFDGLGFIQTKLPKYAVIDRVISTNKKETKQLTYFENKTWTKKTVIVPKDLQVKQLTGTVGKTIADRFKEHRLKNFSSYIPHVTMSIGTDPEIFVVNSKGEMMSAFSFLPNKDKPVLSEKSVRDYSTEDHGSKPVYNDGFQAEFETFSGNCLSWCVDSTQVGLKKVLEEARKVDKGAKLTLRNVMEVSHEILDSTKEEFVQFGCSPSLNAYGIEGKKDHGREVPFRFAGGHIHLGIGKKTDIEVSNIVKSLDMLLALPCVSFFASFDNPIRREYYGLPGEYRLPKHGIEYRTLSNAWLSHPLIMNMVFDYARKIVGFGLADIRSLWEGKEEEIKEIILTCDVDKARKMMDKNKSVINGVMSRTGYEDPEKALKAWFEGIESIIKNPEDIEGNWDLSGKWIVHAEGAGKNWGKAVGLLNKGQKV